MSDTFIDTYKEHFYLILVHSCDLDKVNDVLLGEARFAIRGAHPDSMFCTQFLLPLSHLYGHLFPYQFLAPARNLKSKLLCALTYVL